VTSRPRQKKGLLGGRTARPLRRLAETKARTALGGSDLGSAFWKEEKKRVVLKQTTFSMQEKWKVGDQLAQSRSQNGKKNSEPRTCGKTRNRAAKPPTS